MSGLTPLSRRRFGQGLGLCLTLAGLSGKAEAGTNARSIEVRITGFAFIPAHVDIRAGDTVVWVNEDLAPHTATARDGSWDTNGLETGAKSGHTFQTAGEFQYICAFHPHMSGTLSVRPRAGGPEACRAPIVRLRHRLAKARTIT